MIGIHKSEQAVLNHLKFNARKQALYEFVAARMQSFHAEGYIMDLVNHEYSFERHVELERAIYDYEAILDIVNWQVDRWEAKAAHSGDEN